MLSLVALSLFNVSVLLAPIKIDFCIIGTRTNTNISKVDTPVGGHHQCGYIRRVRAMDRPSCCGRGGDACVATG